MNIELKQFQQEALKRLRSHCAASVREYTIEGTPQIVSFTAPTGAGKTIIMSALLESIFIGDDVHIEQPNSIAVWLSDDPELNEQSKEKLETRADRLPFGQCVTITEADFDRPVLEDGKIYFINTQKFSSSSKLTKHSDSRQNTIWETLRNTIQQKGDRLYFIIDEAHRGAKTPREQGQATTIMQKFILGDQNVGLPPMPVVIGMSATLQRFNNLVAGTTSTVRSHRVSADEVRRSGLLKDRITIAYPEEQIAHQDMAVLQAATDEWIDKSKHWFQYCQEQHYSHVNPIMLVQVENGTGNTITNTDINDCITKIETRYGKKFREGEVVHSFGSPKTTLAFGQYQLPYVEPSRISESQNIKVVFFKDTLSTGWDCPRAEAMMSFRKATDSTYIAQLLGRMIRTPKQMRIQVDETLNEVKLFLPHFNQETVDEVIKSLKEIEGGDLPTDVAGEGMSGGSVQVLTVTQNPIQRFNISSVTSGNDNYSRSDKDPINTSEQGLSCQTGTNETEETNGNNSVNANGLATNAITSPAQNAQTSTTNSPIETSNIGDANSETSIITPSNPVITTINRSGILDYINQQGFKSYTVRQTKVNDYLKSLFKLARLITYNRIDNEVLPNIEEAAATVIKSYIDLLKSEGEYDAAVKKVMEFRMQQNTFDSFGERVDNNISKSLFSTTDSDIDRQLRLSESQLGNLGIAMKYADLYGDSDDDLTFKVDVILFTSLPANREHLQDWSKVKFHELSNQYRRQFVTGPQSLKDEYQRIIKDGDAVSEGILDLPKTIEIVRNPEGQIYTDHLYGDSEGKAQFKLNTWEGPVIEAERQGPDFVCWLRNPSRKSWALTIPYEINNEEKPMYPDFLIIRKEGDGYVIDILEPHNGSLGDNLPKAKGLAKYARNENQFGRIQLIRLEDGIGGTKHIRRLELTDMTVRDKVLHCNTDVEFNSIFQQYSFE